MTDLAEALRFKEQVANRLKGQRNRVRGPHCWYCGKGKPWWECDCVKARAAKVARDNGRLGGYPHWNSRTSIRGGLSRFRRKRSRIWKGRRRYERTP